MLTLADVMAHLCVQIGAPLAGSMEQKVRTAVLAAWGNFFSVHSLWRWNLRTRYLQMAAAQTTGTVAFDLDALTVTLTDATWPTNATDMHIRLGNSWYPVYARTSSTVLTLKSGQCPPADLAAGTTYHIQQVVFPLPVEVGNLVSVVDTQQSLALAQVQPISVFNLSEAYGDFAQPQSYALVADSNHPGKWCLWTPFVLGASTALKYLYHQRIPERAVYREDAGSVSVSSGVATFSDEICRAEWEGAVLRVSRNDDTPTGNYGDMPVSDLIFNQDMDEMKIVEYLTSTTCKVSSTSVSATDAPFTVSSHIDVRPGSMETLILRLAEDQYGVRPVANHMEGITSQRRVREALSSAMTDDSTFVGNDPLLPKWFRTLADIAGSP